MPVLINKRKAISKNSGAYIRTIDICRTSVGSSVVNIPYTNLVISEDAENMADKVFVHQQPVCHKHSYFSKSSGDEPGNLKGINSNTIQGKAEFITGSHNVFIQGIPAVREGDLMVSNHRNTSPAPVMLS